MTSQFSDHERTLLIIKPDAVKRRLIGNIITRIEQSELAIAAMKMMRVPDGLAREHYAEHVGKPFFSDLVAFITSGPVVAMLITGPDAIARLRQINGATNPANADPGTIRGDLAESIQQNCVHGSDSVASAARELALWFPDETL